MTFIPEKNYKLTPGNEQLIVERNTIFSSEPLVGNIISKFRETIVTSSSGIVSASLSQIIIGTGETAGSTAKLTSKKRAEYISGFSAEIGLGIIVPVLPSGDQTAMWGYYDSNNGFGSGVDSTGSFFFKRNSGVDVKTYQTNWNVDKLDGSGSSGLTLDLTQGVICELDFTWYGLGDINLFYRLYDENKNERRELLVHKETITGSLSFNVPNQPITCEVSNGSTASDFYVIIGGRQITLFGKGENFERVMSTYVTGALISSREPTTIATFKKKDVVVNDNSLGNFVQATMNNVSFISDQPIVYEIVYGLSGSGITYGNFVNIPNMAVSESIMEYQVTGSNWAGDTIVLSTGFVAGGNAPNSKNLIFDQSVKDSKTLFGDNDVIQIRAGKLSVNNATVAVSFDWIEKW